MTVLPAGIEVVIIPKLKEGERMVIYVDVGNLPNHKAMEYLEQVKAALQEREDFKDEVCIFAPTRDGVRSVVVQTEPLVEAQTDSAGDDVFT